MFFESIDFLHFVFLLSAITAFLLCAVLIFLRQFELKLLHSYGFSFVLMIFGALGLGICLHAGEDLFEIEFMHVLFEICLMLSAVLFLLLALRLRDFAKTI